SAAARDGVNRPGASLSVFCLTAGPGPRVAALLDSLRPAADEILVALDERADDAVLDDLATVADRISGYPYAEPVDRPLPWRYERLRPGMRIGGRALNFACFVLELRPEPLLAPLPPAEREHVEAVLRGERPSGRPHAEVSRLTREEIDARWPATAPEVQDGRL